MLINPPSRFRERSRHTKTTPAPPVGVTVLEVLYIDIFLAEWRFSDTIDDTPNDPPDLRINGQSPNSVDSIDGNKLRMTYGFVDNGYPWTTSHYTPGDILFTSGAELATPQAGNVI
jgi:hypothetical protein